jgi:hyperosmotically inducible protein
MLKCNKLILATLLALPLAGVTLLTGCASAEHQESTGQYVDSSAVTLKVKAALVKDERIKSFAITVNTYKNVVQLSGFVNTAAQKARAGDVARRVEGVQQVDNAIVVKPR